MIRRIRCTVMVATLVMVGGGVGVGGCQNDAQTGGLAGAGIGALAGQAIGGDTESTLIGAAVGGGAGYIIGNERDKAKARRETPRYQQTSAPARPRSGPAPGALAGTHWEVVNLVQDGSQVEFISMRMSFENNGRYVVNARAADGRIRTTTGVYSVVGDTLLLEDDYGGIVNATHRFTNGRLIISAPDYRAVLERTP